MKTHGRELPIAHPVYSPVRLLMVYLTEDCNLRCTYCFVKKTPKTMSVETAEQVVDYFLQRSISGNVRDLCITFFGGEPFLAIEVMEHMMAYAVSRGSSCGKRFRFAATTNGTLAGKRVEELIRKYEIQLLVSIDGGEGAMRHRPYVGGGSPAQAIYRNLSRLKEWSPLVIVRQTYHPEALDLRANAERLLDLGAASVAICPVTESDWNGSESRLCEAHLELADWFIEEARAGRWLPLEVTWNHLRLYHRHHLTGARPSRPCPVGTSLLGVNAEGKVMPCHRFLYRRSEWLGSVADTDLPASRSDYVALSSSKILGCDTCSARTICGGGCRVLASASGRDLSESSHPGHCVNTRAQMLAVERIYRILIDDQPDEFVRFLIQTQSAAEMFGELTA